MLIYSANISPRLRYTLKVIFQSVLNTPFKLTTDLEEFISFDGPRVNYSRENVDDILRIIPDDLLFEKDIFEQEIHLFDWNGIPAFFRNQRDQVIPFDLFAATFYLVCRYEEYLPFIPDQHGRFTAKESLAHKEGFLEKPIVNYWIKRLLEAIQKKHPGFKPKGTEFKYISTIDVDNAYAYVGKGGFRTIGGILKDIAGFNFLNFKKRISSLIDASKDPFDTFDFQMQIHKKYGVESIYFMLFSEFGQYDRNISMYHPRTQATVKHYNDYTELGIHPSYASNQSRETLKKELRELENVLGKSIHKSRQHFLRLELSKTLRHLVDLGITDDFTMGYAWHPGFRSSICHPYPFYDLEMEVELPLTVHPFTFMEMTFILYNNEKPDQAWKTIKNLINEVKHFDGELTTVWHNRTFSEEEFDWKGWNKLYEKMLQYITGYSEKA